MIAYSPFLNWSNKVSIFLLFVCFAFTSSAQSVDEIINKYFENSGGLDKIQSIQSIHTKILFEVDNNKLPMEVIEKRDGKRLVRVNFQGHEIIDFAFDGTDCWETNFEILKPQKLSSEDTENTKRFVGDFFSPFIEYKTKGYVAEKLANEKIQGADCYKIKLTKKTILVEGKEMPCVQYYYFETESCIPILVEEEILTGEDVGQIAQTFYSDYQSVDGVYFPFTRIEQLKGEEGGILPVESIVLNYHFEDQIFLFPGK